MKAQKQLYKSVYSDSKLIQPIWSNDKNRGLPKDPSNTVRTTDNTATKLYCIAATLCAAAENFVYDDSRHSGLWEGGTKFVN